MNNAKGMWWYSPKRNQWCSPDGLWHAHKPYLSTAVPVAWHPQYSPPAEYAQPLPNVVLGGRVSQELFEPLFEIQRQARKVWMSRHTPNALWLATSLAFIALGVLAL